MPGESNAHTPPPDLLTPIFSAYDELARLEMPNLAYGLDWKMEDGIILYSHDVMQPRNILHRSNSPYPHDMMTNYLSGLFKILWPEIPIRVFSHETSAADWAEAAEAMPNALLVLCLMPPYHAPSPGLDYGRLLKIAPAPLAGRIIASRQLGDFLPQGTRETKFYDYFRKTVFPAEPANRKKIFRAFDLFEEPFSRATFAQILKRYLLRADSLIPVVESPMYFEDLFTLGDNEVIVDCGGFDGDTLQFYLEKVRKNFAEYHVFEPDPANFERLLANVGRLAPEVAAKVRPWQKALAHTPGKLEFEGRGELESRVDTQGGISVESVPLDVALEGISPTLIKMDLEGFESFALLGARNTIKRARPVLSICVYHYPFDLWELPLLMSSFCKGYRFFLRAYDEMFDYVCYAVPEERLANKQAQAA